MKTNRFLQSGITYLALLFIVAIMGTGFALIGNVWSKAQQREKEKELLFVGNEFRRAIEAYYEKSPGSVKQYPHTLEDLLKDNRFLNTQRRLRKIYRDPITGKAEWGLVEAPGSTFMGVYSLSPETPIKQNNFRDADKAFEGKSRYSAWKFVYIPAKSATPAEPAAPGKSAAPTSPVTTLDAPVAPVTPTIPVLSEPPSL